MVHKIKLTVTFILISLQITQLNARPAQDDQFVLFEGDMMVEKGFIEHAHRINKRGAILSKRGNKTRYYWPGSNLDASRIIRVPYTLNMGFFSTLFGTGAVRSFRKAIEEYSKRTCVRFEEKTDEDKDYLEIFSGSGCWSQIGRRGGKQQVSLGSGCEYTGRIIHELMHAVGFLHEQSRHDRDQHVKIITKNIQPGKLSQFKAYRQDTGNLPYDFHSLMHYSNKFFSKNNKTTIEARIDPSMELGLEGGFSALDVVRINLLYKCPQLATDLVLYFVTVYTSNAYFSGTDSKIDILLSGERGDSGEIELEPTDENPDPFERGSKDTFPVIVPRIGQLSSLRLRLASNTWLNWWSPNAFKLDRVIIETPDDIKKRQKLVLVYNRWMYSGDHIILRPPSSPHT